MTIIAEPASPNHLSNVYEKAIIQILYSAYRSLNTNEIATRLPISWASTKKYLYILKDKGYVINRQEGSRMFWRLKTD